MVGAYVTISSSASNLVANDSNGVYDAFRLDTTTGATTLVSSLASGGQADLPSLAYDMTSDGRYVLVLTAADGMVAGDSDGREDLYRIDMATGVRVRVTATAGGEPLPGPGIVPYGAALSDDGTYAVFGSFASLVPQDTNDDPDLYRKDFATGVFTLLTRAAAEVAAAPVDFPVFSDNGTWVAWVTTASVLPADTDTRADAYAINAVTGEIRWLSIATNAGSGEIASDQVLSVRAISDDGGAAAFTAYGDKYAAGGCDLAVSLFLRDTALATTSVRAGAHGGAFLGADGTTLAYRTGGGCNFEPLGPYVVERAATVTIVPLALDPDALLPLWLSPGGQALYVLAASSLGDATDTNGTLDLFRLDVRESLFADQFED